LGGGVIVDARARRHGRAAAHRERLAGPVGEAAAKGAEAAKDAAAGGGAKGAAGGARAKGVAGARGAAPSPAALELAERLRAAAHEPPTLTELGDDAALIDELRQAELVVRLGRDRYAHVDAVAAVRARVEALIARDGAVTLAALRDDLATSRQFAQALLEHLDSARVTRRLPDDRRVLRRNVRG
jgi:selenocysteine-specific elongation factor